LSRPANQNDWVSAQVNKIKTNDWLTISFVENPQNNGFISKLRHYWLELPIPEWVSLVWPMRGLLSLILMVAGNFV